MITALWSGFLEMVSTFSICSDCPVSLLPVKTWPYKAYTGLASQQKGSLCVEASKEWNGHYHFSSGEV